MCMKICESQQKSNFYKMCSVGDDVEEQENSKFMQATRKFSLADNKCTKCRTEQPQVVLHNKYPYCKSCFIAATVHKFKALLGKNRVVHANDNVLIYHQAGHPSTAILHFLRTGLDLTTPKKIRFKPIVVYIESHFNLSLNQRKEILKQINDEVKHFNFPLYFVSLIQYVQNPNDLSSLIQEDYKNIALHEDDATNIKTVLKKKTNLTVQQEILRIFRSELLLNAAKHLNCKSVFTPDLGINIASQLLTNISLGRGAHAVYDTGLVDSRDKEVNILRPLRNFTMKELAFYNIFNNLEPVTFTNTTHTNPYSSVQNLMEKFVSDLQVNYPATVSTIVRTGDKLGLDKNLEQNQKCPLCRAPLENCSDILVSAEATNFSHWVSTQTPNCDISLEDRSKHLLETFNSTRNIKYCFACSRIADCL